MTANITGINDGHHVLAEPKNWNLFNDQHEINKNKKLKKKEHIPKFVKEPSGDTISYR